jgi:hypothetical protein
VARFLEVVAVGAGEIAGRAGRLDHEMEWSRRSGRHGRRRVGVNPPAISIHSGTAHPSTASLAAVSAASKEKL